MNTFMILAPLVTGLLLVCQSFFMSTSNFRSAMIFQYLPFIGGVSCVFTAAKLAGWI